MKIGQIILFLRRGPRALNQQSGSPLSPTGIIYDNPAAPEELFEQKSVNLSRGYPRACVAAVVGVALAETRLADIFRSRVLVLQDCAPTRPLGRSPIMRPYAALPVGRGPQTAALMASNHLPMFQSSRSSDFVSRGRGGPIAEINCAPVRAPPHSAGAGGAIFCSICARTGAGV
jgi:hypothetical protein